MAGRQANEVLFTLDLVVLTGRRRAQHVFLALSVLHEGGI
jgi:hypothetical protein